MKRSIAITFLFLFLSANTAFGQLLRLPTLIHHYFEHVRWDKNPSVMDFLATHYTVEINHPDDQHHDHENLPFRALDCQAIQVSTILTHHNFSIAQVIPEMVEIKKNTSKQDYYSNAYLNSIWQPPRI